MTSEELRRHRWHITNGTGVAFCGATIDPPLEHCEECARIWESNWQAKRDAQSTAERASWKFLIEWERAESSAALLRAATDFADALRAFDAAERAIQLNGENPRRQEP